MSQAIFQAAAATWDPRNKRPDVRKLGWNQFYSDLRSAIDKAGSDLIEARWDYIVIEETHASIWPNVVEGSVIWLHWNETIQKWEPCDEPEWAQGTCHWTF